MKFTKTHEWIELRNDNKAVVGISMHAQQELGDIVYVELPQVGKAIASGQEAAVLESVKAAADVYSPVAGTIQSVNEALIERPELVNRAPESEGWIFTLTLADKTELDGLMDRETYLAQLK